MWASDRGCPSEGVVTYGKLVRSTEPTTRRLLDEGSSHLSQPLLILLAAVVGRQAVGRLMAHHRPRARGGGHWETREGGDEDGTARTTHCAMGV